MSKLQSDINNDEIDLLELINVFWNNRLKIVAITAVAAFISVIYALSQPIFIKRKHS